MCTGGVDGNIQLDDNPWSCAREPVGSTEVSSDSDMVDDLDTVLGRSVPSVVQAFLGKDFGCVPGSLVIALCKVNGGSQSALLFFPGLDAHRGMPRVCKYVAVHVCECDRARVT